MLVVLGGRAEILVGVAQRLGPLGRAEIAIGGVAELLDDLRRLAVRDGHHRRVDLHLLDLPGGRGGGVRGTT